jgi:hypothetical protein
MKRFLIAAVFLAVWAFSCPAYAQPVTQPCYYDPASKNCTGVAVATPLPITGSFSAAGFAPNGNYANLTATGSSASVGLPAGTVVAFQNTGTTTVSCTLGVGSATATANEIIVPPSSAVALTVGSNNFGACIDQTGSVPNVVVLAGGTGAFSGFGGGGGGSGGSVTQGTSPWVDNVTQWASVALGAPTAWGTSPSGNVLGANVNITAGLNANVANNTTIAPSASTTSQSAPVVGFTYGYDGTNWRQVALDTNGNVKTVFGSAQTVGLVAGTAAIGTVTGNVNVTPTNCSGTITSGGTAQNAIAATATIHGFTIANIDTSAGSGEPLWISFTTTAAASTAASYPLAAPTATTFAGLSSFTTPLGFGMNTALSVIAATTGHKFSCTYW